MNGRFRRMLEPGEDRLVELRKFEFVVGRILDFFDKKPDVLTTALNNAHKFVPERVFTMGNGAGANSLTGAAGVLGDFLSGPANSGAPAPPQQ